MAVRESAKRKIARLEAQVIDLAAECRVLQGVADRLYAICESTIACEDTLLRDGTAQTVRKTLTCIVDALADVDAVMSGREEWQHDENAVVCDGCHSILSPASESAGACLRCLMEQTFDA